MDNILKDINVKKRIRDPLYGFIYLTDAEVKIIDTPLFQRLRRVHQLALTKYVYPSAEHSRFVHSLGVLHTSTAIFAGVCDHPLTTLDRGKILGYAKLLRFAALLHDVGHMPFSHAAEKPLLNNIKHENVSEFIICNYGPIKSAIEDEDVSPEVVASLLSNRYRPRHRIIHEIISGQLDADRADYLLRDSYSCGVRYGEYDFQRYASMFAAEDVDGELRLLIEEKDIHIAEAFLLARYHYQLQVPFHRTRGGYDCVLGKFLQSMAGQYEFYEAENGVLKQVDFEKLAHLDDYCLFEDFKKGAREGDFFGKCLLREDHLRPILDTMDSSHGGGSELYKSLVVELEKEGFKKDEDFFTQERPIDIPHRLKESDEAPPSGKCEASSPCRQNTICVRCRYKGAGEERVVDICDHSWIFRHFNEKPPNLLRVFVVPRVYDRAHEILTGIQSKGGGAS